MKITFLGTGTSVGIPVIGCECPVCASRDPHNRRRRTSLYVETAGARIVVDTPPDFREQALEHKIRRVDAVLFTHSHADHVFGFDDIRRFNTIQESVIPVYASAETIADLKRIFDYVTDGEHIPGTYRPRVEFRPIAGPFAVEDVRIDPLPVTHGPKATLGYLFLAGGKSLGYVPDCHHMSDDVLARLRGVDVMVLDALRERPHATHLSVTDSVTLLQRIGARQSYIVHMCHDLDHEATRKALPASMFVSYDGLVLEW